MPRKAVTGRQILTGAQHVLRKPGYTMCGAYHLGVAAAPEVQKADVRNRLDRGSADVAKRFMIIERETEYLARAHEKKQIARLRAAQLLLREVVCRHAVYGCAGGSLAGNESATSLS